MRKKPNAFVSKEHHKIVLTMMPNSAKPGNEMHRPGSAVRVSMQERRVVHLGLTPFPRVLVALDIPAPDTLQASIQDMAIGLQLLEAPQRILRVPVHLHTPVNASTAMAVAIPTLIASLVI